MTATSRPLTPRMANLLDAMKKGAICHFMSPDGYYFRSDTMRHCTREAQGLLARGLVEAFDHDDLSARHKLRYKKLARKHSR